MITRDARVLLQPSPEFGYLPEGPRVLPDGRLLWISIQLGSEGELAERGALHTVDLTTGEGTAWELPGRPGFALPGENEDVFLVGMERAIGWLDLHAGTFEPIADELDDHCQGTIINDGEPCSQGILFGMKDTTFREHKGGLYFLRKDDDELLVLTEDQLCSNGKIVRELDDGTLELFNIDSPTRLVQRYVLDLDAKALSEPQTVVDLRSERAMPDGMIAVPDSDEIVIAMFDPEYAEFGRALRCSLDTGEITAEYRTHGAAQMTCPAWLETEDGPKLVLTTASENLEGEQLDQQPNAGCLFVVDA